MLRTVGAFLLLAILLIMTPRIGWAQENPATPGPAATPIAETPVAEAPEPRRDVLLQATIDRDSAAPVIMRLLEIELDPEGYSAQHAHPGVELGVVESGTLAVRVEGRAVVQRADAASEAGELVPTGVEVTLGPGDRIAYAPGTLMTFRNPGPGQTTILAATILPTGPGAPPGAIYPGGPPTAEDNAGIRSMLLGEVVTELPQRPSGVVLERLQLTAGDMVPAFAGAVLAVIEDGALSGSVLAGEFEVLESTVAAAPAAAPDLSLASGQAIFFPRGMADSAPLGGEGSVSLLRLGIVPLAASADGAAVAAPSAEAEAAEAEAAAAPGSFPIDARVVVTVAEARLRAEPSLTGLLVSGLAQDSVLIITGAPVSSPEHVWYPVAVVDNPALTGFIAAELIAPAP